MAWTEVEEEDDNLIIKLERPRLRQDFLNHLKNHSSSIASIVSEHLSLRYHQKCIVADSSEWRSGDFNVCIPISITNWKPQRLVMRCPFPHMLCQPNQADTGNIDEKLRCEAATYAWIRRNCSQVRIPYLWGFGLSNGLTFTPIDQAPWLHRVFNRILDAWSYLCGWSRWVPFVPYQAGFSLTTGFLLVENIEPTEGTMLSSIWPPPSTVKRRNFYKSFSQVMLSLTSKPLPKIGSFTVDNLGHVTLTNRPLIARLPLLESEGIPVCIPRVRTYHMTHSYIRDLLHCHDAKLRHQPNAVREKYDAEAQMAVLTILRAIYSDFTLDRLQNGPFAFVWTDDHASNIYVDKDYRITCLIDLEWFCAAPLEAMYPPFWLTGLAVDELGEDNKGLYETAFEEYFNIFEQEDTEPSAWGPGFRAKAMRDSFETKAPWLWATLYNPRGAYNIFTDHLQPEFAPSHWLNSEEAIWFQRIIAAYWSKDANDFISRKVKDRETYLRELRSRHRDQHSNIPV